MRVVDRQRRNVTNPPLGKLSRLAVFTSEVAESVLVKHQLLILNRSRKRSPHLRLSDRILAAVCALLMRRGRLIRSAIVLKPSTLLRVHRALTKRKYRLLFSPTVRKKPGPKGPSAGTHGRRRRDETAESDVGGVHGSRNRSPWPLGFLSIRMWSGAFSLRGTSRNQTRRALVAHRPRSCEGQSVESRSVSM
jgi:hypothetical protein